MAELTQEELNGLSPRARIAHEQANNMIQEIVEVPTTSVPLAQRQEEKKVEILKEVIEDTIPSDVEPEVTDDEDI